MNTKAQIVTTLPPPQNGTLRVVHVVSCFGSAGGMEKGVATLIRNSAEDIEHVVVVLSTFHDTSPPGAYIVLDKRGGNSFRFIWKLSRTLRGLRPCVVHTRNWPGLDGVIAARLAGIRAVVHGEHGWGMADMAGTNTRRQFIRRMLSRWMRRITCVSRDIERWLTDDVRAKCPAVQIYNGIDTDAYCPGDDDGLREELGIAPEAPLIGIVARLDAIKDHATLFAAFRKLREGRPDAQLICVGEGPEEERIQALAGPGVHLLGDRKDVARVLKALDLFVLPSHNEGISNTILEAMASGLPVLATRVGGNPELVVEGETGGLFEVGDIDALAKLMERYLENPEARLAHGRAGRQRAIDVFGVGKMVESYEEVWRTCARETKP